MSTRLVRATHTAVTASGFDEPWDTLHLKVFYPALPTGSDVERLTGRIPVDVSDVPLPVAIILNGIEVTPESYRWLAEELAAGGLAVVTFSWVSELFGGQYGLTPGVDIAAASAGSYGTGPTCPGIAAVLEGLKALTEDDASPLHAALDLSRVALVGHSAGGTMVLQNMGYFDEVVAGVTYGAHNLASEMLGHEQGMVLDVTGDQPILMMGGTMDGVIARSADRYGEGGHQTDPLDRTFHDGLGGRHAGSHLVRVDGATHFAMTHPIDLTAARAFLEPDQPANASAHRQLVGALTVAYLSHHLQGASEEGFIALLADPLIATHETN